jgi:sulfur carrier protein
MKTSEEFVMNIHINGQRTEIKSGTLLSLLVELKLNPQTTVVEKNGSIIRMTDYAGEALRENDVLELIRFVGGG